jgi:DNA-binding MarR family transcriptional regulator
MAPFRGFRAFERRLEAAVGAGTSSAQDQSMNAVFFGCKRAFHGCLRITRPWFKYLELTAARFDMLTAVWRHPQTALQSDVRRMLGVTAPTVSRMLRSLETLGFVERTRCPTDRRQKRVSLTAAGLQAIRRATRAFIGSGAAQLAVDCALTGDRFYDESSCMIEMDNAESVVERLRNAFRDIASLYYPWHPDD